MRIPAVVVVAAWFLAGCAARGAPVPAEDVSVIVVAQAEAFQRALSAGDEAAIGNLMAPEVLIYESGGQESSRDEYMSHHMKGDMAFLAKVQVQLIERKQGGKGDLAWVATRSRITGVYRDKPVDIHSTESLVLERKPEGWRIVHVQWSSRPVEPKKAH
ncbi:MAG: YybH family protein [Gammaproteobacteria bacterium]